MFEFLARLFSLGESEPVSPEAQWLDAAIETAVDGTDPRLRLLSDYQQRLRPAAETAIAHVRTLADTLGAPTELSHAAFSTDARVHLLFASADSIGETIARDANVRAFLAGQGAVPDGGFHAVLMARRSSRRMLGVSLRGDVLQNDVPQTVLSFSEHRLVAVSPSLEETLVLVKRGAYRQLVLCALATLTAIRNHDTPLMRERLAAMARFQGGHEQPFWPHQQCEGDREALARLAEIDQVLGQCDQGNCSLSDYLTVVAGVLSLPGRSLRADIFRATVDRLGIVQPEGDAVGTDRVVLAEVHLPGESGPQVVIPVFVPRSEIRPEEGLRLDAVL